MKAEAVMEQPQALLAGLMDGFQVTQLLYVAAELGVADALGRGPCTSAELAADLGAEPGALRRVLRGLAAIELLEELPDGRFGLMPAGALLAEGAPGGLRGAVLARGRLYYCALDRLLDAVRGGGTAFERVHGATLFEYLSGHPEMASAFQGSMEDRSHQEAAAVVAAYDWGRFRRAIDVGGGRGVLLGAILAQEPSLEGVLFDRPDVVEQARAYLSASSVGGRWLVVGGDFFAGVPAGGDAYVLSRVIHDWEDADALRILTSCRRAMSDGATLLLVEAVLPERARDQPAAIRMDLHMLAIVGGRERTAAEYRALLSVAGFEQTRVIPTGSPAGISLLEATPAPDAGD